MFVPSNREIKHKNQLYILLKEILKDPLLSQNLMFKGGTYASLREVLDRFSIDLDFDLKCLHHLLFLIILHLEKHDENMKVAFYLFF